MSFLYPLWLTLLIPASVLMWTWPLPGLLLRVLRGSVLLLVILSLSAPSIRVRRASGTVVIVADRSASMPSEHVSRQKEIIDVVQDAMGDRQRLAVVSYGGGIAVEQVPQNGRFGGFVQQLERHQSLMDDGLKAALRLIPEGRSGRVLLLTDGEWTGGNPMQAAAEAGQRGVALDFRLMQRPVVGDLAVQKIQVPSEVGPGEGLLLHAWLRNPQRQTIRYELRRNRQPIARGERTAGAGVEHLIFRDIAEAPGVNAYTLVVQGEAEDSIPENNRARAIVSVGGTRPVLCITRTPGKGFAGVLQSSGLRVEALGPEQVEWSLERLAAYRAVIVENLAASELTPNGMTLLARWVEATGSGFALTGGQKSYGAGGYFRSALEPILPISMELRREHRKLSLAMVVAMDRSGSMAMAAGGGRTKMDLANAGAVQVLDLLTDMDEFGVVAVDSQSHIVVNLKPVSAARGQRQDILSIESMGGGIFVYEALSTAVNMLQKAEAGTRHIILFADAQDSEEPGQYKTLLSKCTDAGITVSVVGLGTAGDVDAGLLKDIAKRGQGESYFTSDPADVPRIFAQDTFTVARNSFVEEPTGFDVTAEMRTLSGGAPFSAPAALGGFNLCYLRPGAMQAAVTTDEYAAPVIAFWSVGSGRVLAYTGEVDGDFTGAVRGWSDYGRMLSSMGSWVAGAERGLGEGMLATQDIRDGAALIQLHLDPQRPDVLKTTPGLVVLRGDPGMPPREEEVELEWVGPEQLAATIPLKGEEVLLATLHLDNNRAHSLPPVCLKHSPEYAVRPAWRGRRQLERLASLAGGRERSDLAGIWDDLPDNTERFALAPWLSLLAVLIFLAEIIERRIGLQRGGLPKVGEVGQRAAETVKKQASRKRSVLSGPRAPVEVVADNEEGESDGSATSSALDRARRRASGRLRRK